MQVITANYFEAKYLKPSIDYFFVQTSNSKLPNFRVDYDWVVVRPPWRIVDLFKKGKMTWSQYTDSYLGHLGQWPTTIAEGWYEIQAAARHRTIVLLCWCKDDNFCHRTLLYNYLKENHPWN